jgi:hypothetical protein
MASSPASSPLADPLAALDPEAWRALAGDPDQALAGWVDDDGLAFPSSPGWPPPTGRASTSSLRDPGPAVRTRSPWCIPFRGATVASMEWWSIEVLNGRGSAARWKDAYGTTLVEAALTNGAVDWAWHEYRWGVVLELAFPDESRWERFAALPAVQAALDATPDPVYGLAVHRGRGGSSGARQPRRPRPLAGAGAVELPEPDPEPIEEEAAEPHWIEPGFHDDRPAPVPDPSRVDEPATGSMADRNPLRPLAGR